MTGKRSHTHRIKADPAEGKVPIPLKDKVTMIVSISALLVSAVGFYYNSIRVVDHLEVRFISTEVQFTKRDSIYVGDTLLIQVAFINLGNRLANVLPPSYQLSSSRKGGNVIESVINNRSSFPFTLEPHESRYAELKIGVDRIVNRPGQPAGDTSYCGVKFVALDSDGMVHTQASGRWVEIHTKGDEIRTAFIPKDVPKYSVVVLFPNKLDQDTLPSQAHHPQPIPEAR